jgi:hypothetical protein
MYFVIRWILTPLAALLTAAVVTFLFLELAWHGTDLQNIIHTAESQDFTLKHGSEVVVAELILTAILSRPIKRWLTMLYFASTKVERKNLHKTISQRVKDVESTFTTHRSVGRRGSQGGDELGVTHEYVTDCDKLMAKHLERARVEIQRGDGVKGVDEVIAAIQEPGVTEIVATTNSPVHLWFVSEMVGYLVAQLKVAMGSQTSVHRYILDEKGEMTPLFLRANIDDCDEYAVIKEIHKGAMKLNSVIGNHIPKSFQDLETKNVLLIKRNGEDLVWTFGNDRYNLHKKFTPITLPDVKKDYINALTSIKSAQQNMIA